MRGSLICSNKTPPQINFPHTKGFPQVFETSRSKGLSENVCNLLFSATVFQVHSVLLDLLPHIMKSHLDVLALAMHHWILRKVDGRLIIYLYHDGFFLQNPKKLLQAS